MSNNEDECQFCEDYECKIDELEKENDEHTALIRSQVDDINEHVKTIDTLKEQAVDHSAKIASHLSYALRVLVEVNVQKIIEDAKEKEFDERLDAYSEAIDMVFPEETMDDGFTFMHGSENLMDCEFQLYDAHLGALFETFDSIDFNDEEFIDAYKDHVKTSNGTYFLTEHTDVLLLIYVLCSEQTTKWINEWPNNDYTNYLKRTLAVLLVRHESSELVTPLSQSVYDHLLISPVGVVYFDTSIYQLYFRGLCIRGSYTTITSLLRRAKIIDGLFRENSIDNPEIAAFWEWVAANDNLVASLYPKIKVVSWLKDTPLYRRINVLKLNGTIS